MDTRAEADSTKAAESVITLAAGTASHNILK
jgi:hypothetical protein